MPEQWLIDPTSEGTGTQLDISADPYAVVEFSSPAPPLETSMAGTIDTEGDLIAARRHQNRQVSFTVEVVGTSQANLDASVATLEAKVAELAREGGTFRRVRADGTYRTADILAADQFDKAFDVTYFLGNLARCTVNLIGKPYVRGTEVSAGTWSETTLPTLTFTVSGVAGDMPALGRLVVTEAQGVDQFTVYWGSRRKDYTAGTSLFYQAESQQLGSGITSSAMTGASGGSAAVSPALTGSTPRTLLNLGSSGTVALTGTYRVFARVWGSQSGAPNTASSSDIGLYIGWQPLAAGSWTEVFNGQWAWPGGAVPRWYVADLGIVQLPVAPLGTQASVVRLYAEQHGSGDQIAVDAVWLVPAERSGKILGDGAAIQALKASRTVEIRHNMVLTQTGASSYSLPLSYEGDYLTVDPSATTEFIVKASRREQPFGGRDDGIDDISAQLYVTPRYLSMF
jgi:hypothetical protein